MQKSSKSSRFKPFLSSVLKLFICEKPLTLSISSRIAKYGYLGTTLKAIRRVRTLVCNFLLPWRMTWLLKASQYKIDNGFDVQDLRTGALLFVESMRLTDDGLYGRYRYCYSQRDSLLYASVYAALTRSLYGDLDSLSDKERFEWISHIQSFQDIDGLFRDKEIACDLAQSVDWWGWTHLTYHTLMALSCLGAQPLHNLPSLEHLKTKDLMIDWFNDLGITNYPNPTVNVHLPLYYITFLQYSRDYLSNSWANSAINNFVHLANEQIDLSTGCWSTKGYENNIFYIGEGVKIGYHLWILYFYDKLYIPCPHNVIDSLVLSQNNLGGFAITLNSSACDDIDSIDPLCRLLQNTDYRKLDIESALERAVPWVLANRNCDGGFVFKRDELFKYGHEKMLSLSNESNLFATWFRSLSLAYISKALPNHFLAKYNFNLPRVPGLQFWP